MDRTGFTGTGVALVTPFRNDLEVDYDALKRIVGYVISGGVDYLVVLGTTGESSTLSSEEKAGIIRCVAGAAEGRVPVVAGFGGNDTRSVVASLKAADLSGISAILSVVPYYSKPNQEGLTKHFHEIASATPLPIILYNIPGRTGVNFNSDSLLNLADSCPNVIGVKEASGNPDQINRILLGRKPGFRVISGDDNLTLPLLACGADGVISVTANALPGQFSQMVRLGLQGDFGLARSFHQRLYHFTSSLFDDGSPAGIKEALQHLGLCENHLRLPLCPVRQETRNRIIQLLEAIREK